MDADDQDPLTPAERATIDLWRRDQPPPALEARILRSLRREGAIAAPARRSFAALAAAAVLVFTLGLAAGRALPRDSDAAGSQHQSPAVSQQIPGAGAGTARFMLLLTAAPAVSADMEAARVREYGAWAESLAARGGLVAGEKLGDDTATLLPASEGRAPAAPDRPTMDEIQGYFIIVARNLQEAIAVARTCPHLRHGGKVKVRPIDQ